MKNKDQTCCTQCGAPLKKIGWPLKLKTIVPGSAITANLLCRECFGGSHYAPNKDYKWKTNPVNEILDPKNVTHVERSV